MRLSPLRAYVWRWGALRGLLTMAGVVTWFPAGISLFFALHAWRLRGMMRSARRREDECAALGRAVGTKAADAQPATPRRHVPSLASVDAMNLYSSAFEYFSQCLPSWPAVAGTYAGLFLLGSRIRSLGEREKDLT